MAKGRSDVGMDPVGGGQAARAGQVREEPAMARLRAGEQDDDAAVVEPGDGLGDRA